MIVPIGALLAAASTPRTLVGVSLGTQAAQVISAHPEARREANAAGSKWTWKRSGGGFVTVYANGQGSITKIDFVADEGESDSVDIPCGQPFPVQDSHVNMQLDADDAYCVLTKGDLATYQLRDGSMFQALFDGPGDGQLHEAIWCASPGC
jgi:hypothetical protein